MSFLSAVLIFVVFGVGNMFECPEPVAVSDGWVVVEEERFSFRLPPGFRSEEVFEVDSRAGRWVKDESTVGYDYGFYSPPLDLESLPEHDFVHVCQEAESGGPKVIYYNPRGNYAVSAHWPKIQQIEDRYVKLTITATSPDQHDVSVLLAIINSVEIDGGE